MAQFKPGDVFLEQSKGWIGKAIRRLTQAPAEASTWANHTGIFVDPVNVVEALWTVREHPFTRVKGKVQVWRLTTLGDQEREDLARAARAYVGRSYGWWKLGVHLADAGLSRLWGGEIFAFRRLLNIDRYPICSWVVAAAYWRVLEYRFGVDPAWADPDHIHDHLANSSLWERIDELKEIEPDWSRWPHFYPHEVQCPCCGLVKINPILLDSLERLRELAGNRPIPVTSGYRCPKRNQEVGGGGKSQHLLGNAADIRIVGLGVRAMFGLAEQIPAFAKGGIGVYPDESFIHVDVRPNGPARWAGVGGGQTKIEDLGWS